MPAVAALVVLLDQLTKHLVTTRLDVGQSWDIVPGLAPIFRITLVTNTGAAFGLLQGWSNVFIVIAIIVITVIIFYTHSIPDGQTLMRVAMGLQLGGAMGNLVDRLRYQGSVVDFFDLNFWPLREWPVFNVADASIVSGVTLLALLMLWEERREYVMRQAAEDA